MINEAKKMRKWEKTLNTVRGSFSPLNLDEYQDCKKEIRKELMKRYGIKRHFRA